MSHRLLDECHGIWHIYSCLSLYCRLKASKAITLNIFWFLTKYMRKFDIPITPSCTLYYWYWNKQNIWNPPQVFWSVAARFQRSHAFFLALWWEMRNLTWSAAVEQGAFAASLWMQLKLLSVCDMVEAAILTTACQTSCSYLPHHDLSVAWSCSLGQSVRLKAHLFWSLY